LRTRVLSRAELEIVLHGGWTEVSDVGFRSPPPLSFDLLLSFQNKEEFRERKRKGAIGALSPPMSLGVK
jgi:hypothetical protein